MLAISDTLNKFLHTAFENQGLDVKHAVVVPSNRPELADYQCNGALALAKPLGKNPREIANALVDELNNLTEAKEIFSEVSIAGAGFINLKLTDTFLVEHAQQLLNSTTLGFAKVKDPCKIIIDYGGPNMGKPMHTGHLRPAIIGESIRRMLCFAGHDALGDVHFGDWGMPMGMIIAEIEHEQPNLPFFDTNSTTDFPTVSPLNIDQIGEIYRKSAARGKEDEEVRQQARLTAAALQDGHAGYMALWKLLRKESFTAAKENFASLNVFFDLWLGESDTRNILEPMVTELQTAGLAERSQGAIVFPFADIENIPPLMLEKSDGGYTYGTTDLATIKQRTEQLHADKIIYVVDRRQSQHFQQVFEASKRAKYAENCELAYAPFGTINGPDGTPLKSRTGAPPKLEDLLQDAINKARERLPETSPEMSDKDLDHLAKQIGVATIKFQDLHNNRNTDYIFDLEQFSRFEGKTGPYLQYSVARVNSLFDKASETEYNQPIIITHKTERELVLAITSFADSLTRSIDRLEPSALCEQVYTVAQKFSTFYSACQVLGEENTSIRQSRLTLAALVKHHQLVCLDLLGIDAPQKMLTRAQECPAA